MPRFALRFISGKYQGGEFPIAGNSEIVIGRSGDLDMVLVEDMVSRRHAKITIAETNMFIEDMGSTNGTFVNGEKVQGKAPVHEGDRILVGTSIMKIVTSTGGNRRMPASDGGNKSGRPMSGNIDEIPLPDLIQLLSTSKKTGALSLRQGENVGKLFLKKGKLYFATINDNFSISPRKAVFRLLQWTTGQFELEPGVEIEALEAMDESTEALLMQSIRRLDEFNHLASSLPSMTASISLAGPFQKPLRELKEAELDALQTALEHPQLQSYFDHFPGTDLDAAGILLKLCSVKILATHER